MATTRRPSGHQGLHDISKRVLIDLRQDFNSSGRSASDLQQEYQGPSLTAFKASYLEGHGYSEVDFDLALKELEERNLIGTGPHAVYENDPGSSVVILGFYSKREYLYLKEGGYRAASEFAASKVPRPASPRVHISGGTFHQSPIAFGDHATQLQNISTTSDSATVEQLIELLAEGGIAAGAEERSQVALLVEKMTKGNVEEGKPLFKKIFEVAGEGVKQTAWGVLTALASKAMGL